MRASAIATAIAVLVAGCTATAQLAPAGPSTAITRPAPAGSGPTPRPCEQVYSARRCLAMADVATAFSEQTRDDVDSVVILPDPTPEIEPDGEVILQTLGGAAPIRVRLLMLDGTTLDAQMCMGIPSGPACADEPRPWDTTGDLIGGGYHDVPCAGDPPDGCPTPIPSIDPAAQASATPIKVPRVMIPIDRVGGYEVPLGKGSLPNGIVTQATYRLADPWPVDVTFSAEGAPRLEIRSLEPNGQPFQNAYEHGWRDGLERIEAVLVFEVRRFDPGASLEVVEVEVR